jgi:thioesterase domain-containing protein
MDELLRARRDGTQPPTYHHHVARTIELDGADLPAPITPERRARTEVLILLEPARLALNGWRLVARRAPVSRTVMVLPGRGGNDASTAPLRAYLRSLGHEVHGWGLGVHRGEVLHNVTLLKRRLAALHESRDRPVALVGWSLGGIVARELARQEGRRVSHVMTFGAPLVGGAKYTALASTYRARGVDLDETERELARRALLAEHIAVTSIFSKLDGVVSWPACVDRTNPQAENIEVVATHLSLGYHHEVWRLVADRLARPHPWDPASAATDA